MSEKHCPDCENTGYEMRDDERVDCPTCEGRGWVSDESCPAYDHGIACPCPACVAQTKGLADLRSASAPPLCTCCDDPEAPDCLVHEPERATDPLADEYARAHSILAHRNQDARIYAYDNLVALVRRAREEGRVSASVPVAQAVAKAEEQYQRGRADGFEEGLDVPHISSELTAAGDWCAECSRQTNSYTHQELCATGIVASENAREKVRALLSAQKEKP